LNHFGGPGNWLGFKAKQDKNKFTLSTDEEWRGFFVRKRKGSISVKSNKAASKNGEGLALETVQSSPLFTEPPTSMPPIQSTSYVEGEI
jgi:hypothetical protein